MYKKVLLLALAVLSPLFSFAQDAQEAGLDEKINDAVMPAAVWWENLVLTTVPVGEFNIPVVVILLVIGATFFTIYFKVPSIRRFPLAINTVRGKYDDIEGAEGHGVEKSDVNIVDGDLPDTIRDESEEGEVSHFQALATAVSGTVGLGNIAGVAVAIALGGPGATFWMIVCGLIGMATKFVECTLGVKYRDVGPDGTVYGGPMYYLSKGLKERNMAGLGKVLAGIFAILCVGASFGGGNAFQANFSYIDDAFGLIFKGAFTPMAGLGGFLGVLIVGFQRAAFSNEAGAGSAAIAHSAVKTKYPASEGVVALLEPFIDTVVICTMTALVIIFFNIDGTNLQSVFEYGAVEGSNVILNGTGEQLGGVDLTSRAFDSVIPGFSYVLTIAIVLFAFSTMISWSYYGLQSWKYLFGKGKAADLTYKIMFLLFVIIGAAATLDAVIKFSDAMILALVFPNMIGLFFLFPKVREEMKKYLDAIKGLKSSN
ncbi:alanine/glycine:cation symporter family protein [Gilvibacter sediminis]|uniref:alanine/glycine:cation symporter family protein n=1 Tax=Gilvibacter sediminis TaxID=379071 RepID=UPI0023504292|nr:alanine/glycine:cation symporter family protein [Gilvibacter sediminis]MDC7998450.1 alanine/glycine:cation symporter family protein [Gilvibacter sediminis]